MQRLATIVGGLALVAMTVGCSGGSSASSGDGGAGGSDSGAVTTTTSQPSAAAPIQPEGMWQSVEFVPPDSPGKVEVVSVGPPVTLGRTTSVAVVVRNGTGLPARDLTVVGTGRDASGAAVARFDKQVLFPSVLGPGEWGFTSLLIDEALPEGSTVEVTLTDSDTAGIGDEQRLKVVEAGVRADGRGTVVIGTIRNSGPADGDGGFVNALCVNANGDAVWMSQDQAFDVPAAVADAVFEVELPLECSSVTVGGYAYLP